jgi:hypothetical protein
VLAGVLWGGHGIAAVDLSVALAPRSGRPFYLAAFATAGGLGFAAASILAGLLVSLMPAQFMLLGFSWTGIHVLLLVSALARAAAALLAVRIQERDARGVPELLLTLANDLPKTVSVAHCACRSRGRSSRRRSATRQRGAVADRRRRSPRRERHPDRDPPEIGSQIADWRRQVARGQLFSVDDGRVLCVDPQDVRRLVIHVMNLGNAAVACRRRDAGVTRREQDDTPGFGLSRLRSRRGRAR